MNDAVERQVSLLLLANFRTKDLDRNMPVEFQISREVHRRHAATAELTFDSVAARERG